MKAISHIWYDMYGVFDLSGNLTPYFKGTFEECQKFVKGEPVKSTVNYNIRL